MHNSHLCGLLTVCKIKTKLSKRKFPEELPWIKFHENSLISPGTTKISENSRSPSRHPVETQFPRNVQSHN